MIGKRASKRLRQMPTVRDPGCHGSRCIKLVFRPDLIQKGAYEGDIVDSGLLRWCRLPARDRPAIPIALRKYDGESVRIGNV
ncbi:MAG TPA: hypothetical protein VIP78_03370 [Candidatus Dormibacteraeota bacterium]|jgi:hypothetical protein